MRNCDNCNYSSYGLDCNSGTETLYCRETEYEYEVQQSDSCDYHQFIDGMQNEKNFVLYDESYFGEGYFIIHTEDEKVTKFLKLYIMNNDGRPHYGLRAFSIDGRDNPDEEFNRIEFIFRSIEDFDNGLFEAFSILGANYDKEIYTIDATHQGKNNISINVKNGIVKLICSKDVYRGTQHPSDFIDINLGDNYSCQNYEAINTLYNTFAKICHQSAKEQDIKKLIMLKIQ